MTRFTFLLTLPVLLLLASCSSQNAPKSTSPYRYVPGKTAMLQGPYAVPPASAPEAVKRMIIAGNRLQGRPYVYGGGHRAFEGQAGYDCSGTASYVLYYGGQIKAPTTSGAFMNYGAPGPGKWVTIYAKRGHVFTTIAGLRLDTGYNGQNEGPRWSTRVRPSKGFVMRHPPGL